MRGRYNTANHREILACLESLAGQQVTAADVYRHLQAAGSSISRATVYRQLDGLVEDGLVLRFTPENEKRACLQLVQGEGHRIDHCQHLKCEKCGKLIHLDCDEMHGLYSHLASDHGFKVDERHTVIVGLCESCAAQEN